MLANLLIGLREGLEAALVVGILIAFVIKLDRRDLVSKIWLGVAGSVSLSLGLGALLIFGMGGIDERVEQTLTGVLSVVAVGLVTWMIFWMAKTARSLKANLESSMAAALNNSVWSIVGVAFIAVAREGVETALFVWASIKTSGEEIPALLAVLAGIGIAIFLGWVIYTGMMRVNLRIIFQWTGVLLIVVSAGILSYAVHELQEAAWLPGAEAIVYDLSSWLGKETILGSLLRGAFSYSPTPSVLEFASWWLYMISVMTLFVRQIGGGSRRNASTSVTA